jgi:hypothetical protein
MYYRDICWDGLRKTKKASLTAAGLNTKQECHPHDRNVWQCCTSNVSRLCAFTLFAISDGNVMYAKHRRLSLYLFNLLCINLINFRPVFNCRTDICILLVYTYVVGVET